MCHLAGLALGGSCSFSWWQLPWPLPLPRHFKTWRRGTWQQRWTRFIQQFVITKSQTHVGWKGPPGAACRDPCLKLGPWEQVAQQSFKISKDEDSTTSLGYNSLLHCLTTLTMIFFFLIYDDNFPGFSLCPLHLVVALSTETLRRVWHRLLYTISSDGPFLGSPQHVHIFPVLGSLKLNPVFWMCLPSAEQRGRHTSLDLLATLADTSQHTAGSCPTHCPPGPTDPFSQSCSPASQTPACTGVRSCSSRCKTLHFPVLNAMGFLSALSSSLCRSPCTAACPPATWPLLSVWYSPKNFRECTLV